MERVKRVFTLIHLVLWVLLGLLVVLQIGDKDNPNWRASLVGFMLTGLYYFTGISCCLPALQAKGKRALIFSGWPPLF